MLKMVAVTNLNLTHPMTAVIVHSLADDLSSLGLQPYIAQMSQSELTELIVGPVTDNDVDLLLASWQVIALQNPHSEWGFKDTPILVLERDL